MRTMVWMGTGLGMGMVLVGLLAVGSVAVAQQCPSNAPVPDRRIPNSEIDPSIPQGCGRNGTEVWAGPSRRVVASSFIREHNNHNRYPTEMFDNCGHMWTAYGRYNNWVAIDLGRPRSLKRISIDPESRQRAPRNMIVYTAESFNGPWTRQFAFPGQHTDLEYVTNFPCPICGRYINITISTIWEPGPGDRSGAGCCLSIQEMRFFEGQRDPSQCTAEPTRSPVAPTANPTHPPTPSPSVHPSRAPTRVPTAYPTRNPTAFPSMNPSEIPTSVSTYTPTGVPTAAPSMTDYVMEVQTDRRVLTPDALETINMNLNRRASAQIFVGGKTVSLVLQAGMLIISYGSRTEQSVTSRGNVIRITDSMICVCDQTWVGRRCTAQCASITTAPTGAPTTATTNSNRAQDSSSTSTTTIIAAIVAVCVVVFIIIIAVTMVKLRKNSNQNNQEAIAAFENPMYESEPSAGATVAESPYMQVPVESDAQGYTDVPVSSSGMGYMDIAPADENDSSDEV